MITNEIKFSPTIKALFSAILDFKRKVGKIYKTEDNPFFKAKYADLSSVLDETDPKLTECGLVFSCLPLGDNDLTAMLVHAESGEYMMTTFSLNIIPSYDKEKDVQGTVLHRTETYIDPQKWGASLTYARRFTIIAALNLNVDKDGDGNHSGQKGENKDLPWLNPGKEGWNEAIAFLKEGGDLQELFKKHQINKVTLQKLCTAADYSK
jgi:hypothetical protein